MFVSAINGTTLQHTESFSDFCFKVVQRDLGIWIFLKVSINFEEDMQVQIIQSIRESIWNKGLLDVFGVVFRDILRTVATTDGSQETKWQQHRKERYSEYCMLRRICRSLDQYNILKWNSVFYQSGIFDYVKNYLKHYKIKGLNWQAELIN